MTSNQTSGHGLKLGVIYEKDRWEIGPFAYYWNIGESETAPVLQNGIPVNIGWEPENNTVEFGLNAPQKF